MIGLPATVATDTVLRFATPEDAPAISALIRRHAAELGYGTAEEFEIWFDARHNPEVIRARIENPTCRDLVVTERSHLIGCAYIRLDTGYLGGLHVASDGHGIGALLIVALIELAREAGLGRVWMAINNANKRMIGKAGSHGFAYFEPNPNNRWPFSTTASNRYEMFLGPASS